jgi:hypothetical protein
MIKCIRHLKKTTVNPNGEKEKGEPGTEKKSRKQ